MNPLDPQKLLLTKWTAVKPVAKQKHFLVSRVIQPELPTDPIVLISQTNCTKASGLFEQSTETMESVEIEALFSEANLLIPGLVI